jgi:hypothetical protein
MKNQFFVCFIMLSMHMIQAQSVGINNTGAAPESSAILDVSSTTKGALIPRMTKAQKNTITAPAIGLLVYQLSPDSIGFHYFSGTNWLYLQAEEDVYWAKNGNHIYNKNLDKVGIGTNAPLARLHVKDSSVVFQGPNTLPTIPGNPPITNAGNRMMWYADKAALRAGTVFNSIIWSKDTIGKNSIALGMNPLASGEAAVALGRNTKAIGDYSFAVGELSTASGRNSTSIGSNTSATEFAATALGSGTTASGWASTAIGGGTDASGANSLSIGFNSIAKGYASTVLGQFNDSILTSNQTFITQNTPLFIVGNGDSPNNRKNALVVLKNGNTGIGTNDPKARLHVDSSVVFTGATILPTVPSNPPISGAGTRMMWYPDRASFRVGGTTGNQWDRDSIGDYSTAVGFNTKAFGDYSFAAGRNTQARGNGSIALGNSSQAQASNSIALGSGAKARGDNSFSIGQLTNATGYTSIAMGQETFSFGTYSTAFGLLTEAIGNISTSFGNSTIASGSNSTSFGNSTIASGSNSTSFGENTITKGYASTTIGMFNDSILPFNQTAVQNTTPLFLIGNGNNNTDRKNAIVVLKNGNTGIGTNAPAARLHVQDSSVLFTGPFPLPTIPNEPPVNGGGTRMMWYPEKAAFRVGRVDHDEWSKDSIGTTSFASGYGAIASGSNSVAMGKGTHASGSGSIALGNNLKASGPGSFAFGSKSEAIGNSSIALGYAVKATADYSMAIGYNTFATGSTSLAWGSLAHASGSYAASLGNETFASGDNSIATGHKTLASGNASSAMGSNTTASGHFTTALGLNSYSKSYGALTIGRNNDSINSSSRISWVDSDPAFIIGNGASETSRRNAFIVAKNGETGINVANGLPQAGLHIKGIASTFDAHLRLETAGAGTDYSNILYDGNTKFRNFGIGDEYQWRSAANNIIMRLTESGDLTINGTYTSSDKRLKKDIKPLSNSLSKLSALGGYQYYWQDKNRSQSLQTGVIAQEVELEMPELILTDEEGNKAVNYNGLIPHLIEAMKELKKENDLLKKRIEKLEKQ